MDRVTNEEVLRRMSKDRELLSTVKERKLQYVVHIMRDNRYEVLRLVIEGKIEGRRSVGRRQNSWLKDLRRWFGRTLIEIFRGVVSHTIMASWVANLRRETAVLEEEERYDRYNEMDKNLARAKLLQQWQEKWNNGIYGRWTNRLIPDIQLWLNRLYGEVDYFMSQSKLWEALEKTNISITLIRAVQELYKSNTSQVKKGQTVSKGFSINKDLKQGGCLSPTLFKIYLEQALKTWKWKCELMEIPLNDSILYTLCFGDDQIILAQDYEDLEYMTRKLIEEYHKWGLEVNLNKTEYMCIGGEQQNLILEQQQQEIKHCQKYKYLGMHITNDGSLDEEIKCINNQGKQAIRQLNSILWNKAISKENKHKIYNGIVKSIISYCSEVWSLKERNL
ncbi:uncharacterized protein LOC115875475 [Sitophilus oryzae]|uniref:Uncharacterized protein LOC115875475 n=1 Tax=Sitophilus oryzae TaxID=7048 RepID=A0A6J2X6H1_SITOR|nr:uncharacterized protein LOC115875475 [Sitophilus oryzae]